MKLLLVPLLLASTAPVIARVALIDDALLRKFELFQQYALASYCPGNDNASSRTITCSSGACPLVEMARPMNVMGLAASPNYDVNGFIAHDDYNRVTVISFRGSLSLKNWQADLDLKAVDALVCQGCTATRGFWRSWDEARIPVLAAINATVRGFPHHRIVTTGHSLGGAIATLAATELRHMGLTVDLYTYGSPRVGNAILARMIESQSPRWGQNYRITHYNDPVPALPPISLGFSHVGPEYYISTRNKEPVGPADVIVFEETDNLKGNAQFILIDSAAHSWYFGTASDCSAKEKNSAMSSLQQMGLFNQNQDQKAKGQPPAPVPAPQAPPWTSSLVPPWTSPGSAPPSALPPSQSLGSTMPKPPAAPGPAPEPIPSQPASGGILDSISSVFGGDKKGQPEERKPKALSPRPNLTPEDWQQQALDQLEQFKAGLPQPWLGIPGLSVPASWNALQPSAPKWNAPQSKPPTLSSSGSLYQAAPAQLQPLQASQPKTAGGSPAKASLPQTMPQAQPAPVAPASQPGFSLSLPSFGSSQSQQAQGQAPKAVSAQPWYSQAPQPMPLGGYTPPAAAPQPGFSFNLPSFGSSQLQPALATASQAVSGQPWTQGPQPKPVEAPPPQAAPAQPGFSLSLPSFGSSQLQPNPAPGMQAAGPQPKPQQAAPPSGFSLSLPSFGLPNSHSAPAVQAAAVQQPKSRQASIPESGFSLSLPSFGSSPPPPAKPQPPPSQPPPAEPAQSWWPFRTRASMQLENSEGAQSQQVQNPNTRLAALQRRYALHMFKAATEAPET